MKIEKNKMVSLIYELRENDAEGKVIEVLDDTRPLKFLFGAGKLLPEFESNIDSLNDGDSFSFKLVAEKAYGDRTEDMIVNLPLSVFMMDGKLNEDICRIGNNVPMMDSEGNPLNGTIIEISETDVRMDFNHPMAGLDLCFSGRIVEVREPTDNELYGGGHSCSSCGSQQSSGCSGGCS